MRRRGRLDRRWVAGIGAVTAFVVIPACGDDPEPAAGGGGAPGPTTVVLKDIAFKPGTISVKTGDKVTWRFEDKGIPHNVVAGDDSFKSDIKDSGTFQHTFDKAGTFTYSCTVHPGMNGTVKVT
ncbi:MAG TPA: plastocyanin/azurin family copper-binding protein [Acidimicrobiales bacterium]|nr:plastocyanin/azurin family copper-binding protein [Acidimicrobiales bacterium]